MNRRKRKEVLKKSGQDPQNVGVKFPPMIFPMMREWNIGRNDKCPCGSDIKYKKCHLNSGKYETYLDVKNTQV